jgi:RNA polymerase sigma factor (sigma-70 family)
MIEPTSLEEKWMYWYPRVYAYFYRRVNSKFEVEELTANTMNTSFMAKDVLNFQAYLWRVAHNYLVKYINTKTTSPMIVSLHDNTGSEDGFDEEVENQQASHFEDKLKNLKLCIQNHIQKPEDQKLIELCIYEEKNSTEVANILNIKSDNVRQKLSRLLRKLKQNCLELWPANLNQTLK